MAKTLQIEDSLVDAARAATGETDDSAAVERILKGALDTRVARMRRCSILSGRSSFTKGTIPKR